MTWTITTLDGPKLNDECEHRFSETSHFVSQRNRVLGEYTSWRCGHPAATGAPCSPWACCLICGQGMDVAELRGKYRDVLPPSEERGRD